MKCSRCGNDTSKYSFCDECRKYFRKKYREKVFKQTKLFFIKEENKWDISTSENSLRKACFFVSFQEYEEVLTKSELQSFIQNLKFILNENMKLIKYTKIKQEKFNRFIEFIEKNKIRKEGVFSNGKTTSEKFI
ncbi:MAG: hypothetical protein ACLVKE_07305 [Clostridium baratii]